MSQKLAILSCLIISGSCMVIHQVPMHVFFQYPNDPNYNFAYEVNDAHTGDIKTQQESRRGDFVSGQYSLLQPDGVTRIVDYRADDARGFRATVNNEGRSNNQLDKANVNAVKTVIDTDENNSEQGSSTPTIETVTSLPVAISRTSIIQRISNSYPILHYPWI